MSMTAKTLHSCGMGGRPPWQSFPYERKLFIINTLMGLAGIGWRRDIRRRLADSADAGEPLRARRGAAGDPPRTDPAGHD